MVLRHSIKASFCADCAMCQLVNGLFEASLAAVSALYGLVNIVQLEGRGMSTQMSYALKKGALYRMTLGIKVSWEREMWATKVRHGH